MGKQVHAAPRVSKLKIWATNIQTTGRRDQISRRTLRKPDPKKQRLFNRTTLSKWLPTHPTKTPCYLSCSKHQSSPSAHTPSSPAEYRLTSSHPLCCTHPHYWVHLPEHMPRY